MSGGLGASLSDSFIPHLLSTCSVPGTRWVGGMGFQARGFWGLFWGFGESWYVHGTVCFYGIRESPRDRVGVGRMDVVLAS